MNQALALVLIDWSTPFIEPNGSRWIASSNGVVHLIDWEDAHNRGRVLVEAFARDHLAGAPWGLFDAAGNLLMVSLIFPKTVMLMGLGMACLAMCLGSRRMRTL